MKCKFFITAFYSLLIFGNTLAQDLEFYPKASYKNNIPTLEQITGHAWGEKITMHHEAEQYMRALVAASPNVQMVKYGETWEGRALYYLIVASEQNMARIDEIKSGMQKLADPRKISSGEADNFIQSLPSISWLEYGVHGNEISSTDAGLLTAYHLTAAQGDTLADLVLKNSVVIIDPMQNPDGRDRFINYFRQTRGRWPDADQQAAEHREVWPGGRTNHYLFDMNRDWFALTQPETQGRVKAFLEWYPQVFVDLHEMGSNSSYYFAPPADPLNPELPPSQIKWLQNYGKNNARWFDRMHFDYFTREVFDSFYPGYGEGWPMFQGAIGMTYEQASARGLVVKREDKTTMHYRESVQHHFISSLSTCETTARNRAEVLRYFYEYRQSAIEEGKKETVKEFIIVPGSDPDRSMKLAKLLVKQGIEVQVAEKPFQNSRASDYYNGTAGSKRFPAGTFVVSLAQPSKRLAKTLLVKHVDMDEEFIKEQLRRKKKRIRDQIYDVTGWSLPLLYDVECYAAEQTSSGEFSILDANAKAKGKVNGGKAQLAYLIPWGSNAAARTLATLQRHGVRVSSSDKSFTLNGKKYPSGSLIIRLKNNPENLHDMLTEIAERKNVEIDATNTSWVEDGVNFGSGNVRFLKKPKVVLAYNRPVSSYSTGWTRYLIEQQYGYPVTTMHANNIGGADLSEYNVLILPNAFGGYGSAIGNADRLKAWIRAGGTLITYGNATRWLTEEKVALLTTTRELKGGKPDKPAKKDAGKKPDAAKENKPDLSKPFDVEKEIQPEKELPFGVAGAIVRISLDTEHWLAFGYDSGTNVMVSSSNIFTPVKLDKGTNVGLYMAEKDLVLSGFIWEETKKQLANKAYLIHQSYGRGHVVAFAEDPNTRAFVDGTNLLLMNAIFFGPAH
ncbi:MAG: M14 family metallopeptidase [bacterium]